MDQAPLGAMPDRTEGREARTSAHREGDESLVERLRAGDATALEELYDVYRKPIFGFLARLARDRHTAEDLFQNTWLKVSRGAVHLREDTELEAWLFTVARNEYRSYRRWQVIDVSRVFLFYRERAAPWPEPATAADSSVELAALERALRTLGASDREVLLLVCVQGMAPPKAAAVLGVSHAALRQRLGRARTRLKEAIATLETRTHRDTERGTE